MSQKSQDKYPFVSRSVVQTFGKKAKVESFLYSNEVKQRGEELVDFLTSFVSKEALRDHKEETVNFALWQAALLSKDKDSFGNVFAAQLSSLRKNSKESSDVHKRIAQIINFHYSDMGEDFTEITILADDLKDCSILSELIEHRIKVLAMGGKASARFNPKGFNKSLRSLLALEQGGHTVIGEGTDIRNLVPIFCDVMVVLDSKLSVEDANQVNANLVIETDLHQAGLDSRQLLNMRDVIFVPALLTRISSVIEASEFKALLSELFERSKRKRLSLTRTAYDKAARNLKAILNIANE